MSGDLPPKADDATEYVIDPLALAEVPWKAELPSSAIASRTRLSRPAASQHLRVLRDAKLVTVRVEGAHRFYRTRVDRVAEIRAFLDGFWGSRLEAMRDVAESVHRRGRRSSS